MGEEYKALRILAGIMFDAPVEDAERIVAKNPSIPKYLLTGDFRVKVLIILFIKKGIVKRRWRKFVDTCYSKMFSSHQAYLTFVIFACIREHQRNPNIFETIMSVYAFLKFISSETSEKTGVDLSYLNPFIFMQIYYFFGNIIYRQGGVKRLIEFIRDHRHQTFKSTEALDADAISVSQYDREVETELDQKIEKEVKRDCVKEEEIDVDEIANDEAFLHLAKQVLKMCYGIEHPNLPRLKDVVKRLVEYRKKERAERKLLEAAEESAASNSVTESKTNGTTKYQDNSEQYEMIIQAVIRHNHSKRSGHESANNKVQEEANAVLQHLKETIEKLTKGLNELDKD